MSAQSQNSNLKSHLTAWALAALALASFFPAHAAELSQNSKLKTQNSQLTTQTSQPTTFTCSFTRDWAALLGGMPVPTFAGELERLLKLAPAPPCLAPAEPEARPDLLEIELGGLHQALAGLPTTQTQAIVEAYKNSRAGESAPQSATRNPQSAIPDEFALYLEGLRAEREGDHARALQRWGALLALPESERRQRSVWAAYMIGRAGARTDPAGAMIYLEECRRLAASGFADPLGLAGSSLAWQVRAEIEAGQFARALNHLMEQARSVQSAPSAPSIPVDLEIIEEICARACAAEDASALDDFALSPAGRPVMTAFLFTQNASGKMARNEVAAHWLKAVAELGGEPAMAEAEDLAALAGAVGDAAAARRWPVAVAAPDHRAFQSLLAAVLREGPTDRLLELVGRSCRDGGSTTSTLEGDFPALLAAMHLARGEFRPAFQAALESGRWNDIAFLAENVLTLDELEEVARASSPANSLRTPQSEIRNQLQLLLARRLAREGDLARARGYFALGAPGLVPELDKLIRDLRVSEAPGIDNGLRASVLLEAGLLARRHGQALYGTELAPDWAIAQGRAMGPDPVAARLRLTSTLGPGEAERARLNSRRKTQNAKPHLAHTADLLWSAAGLMPDNDPRLAAALWYGGMCLAGDPASADRFYKALALRCAGLPAGREAARLRWFPPTPPPAPPAFALPARIHVSRAGNDANDGASWAAPKRTLAAALASARTTGAPVWVGAGIYPEALDLSARDNGLAIYGGFRGNENDPAERRTGTDALTILDAAGGGRAAALDGLTSFTLDGFLVRGGDARGPGPAGCGGGLFIRGCGPGVVIIRCIIAQNHAANHGGGICLEAASPTLTSCTLAANRADAGGGGLAAFAGSAPRLQGCVFADNGSRFGRGGALFAQDSKVPAADILFAGNWAEADSDVCAPDSAIRIPQPAFRIPQSTIPYWTSVPYYNPRTGLTALVDRNTDFTGLAGRAVLIQPDASRPTVALVVGARGSMVEVLGDFTRTAARKRPYRILDFREQAGLEASGKDITSPVSVAGPLPPATTAAALVIPFTAHDDRSAVREVRLFFRKDRGPWQTGDVVTSPSLTLRFNAARLGPGRYEFYTEATDEAGNREAAPVKADCSINVGEP